MEREAALLALASRQHGVFSRSQALAAGMTPKMVAGRLAASRWQAVDRGVYGIAGAPATWHRRLVAACLAGPAVASHRSAGLLWSFPGMPEEIIELTAFRHRRRHAPDVVWHESYVLPPDQVTEIQGIPVTSALRTFLDLAGVVDMSALEAVANEAIRRGLFTALGALAMIDRLGPLRRGSHKARSVLDLRRPGERPPESVLETRFLQLVRKAGFPEPVPQYEVRAGDRTIRVDFAYPDLKVAIELDGEAFHWGARAERRDHRRDELLGDLGWLVLRFTWKEVHDFPRYVIAALRAPLSRSA